MDLQAARDSLEKAAARVLPTAIPVAPPYHFFDNLIVKGLQIDHAEPGRVVCSMRVPPRLLNDGNYLHGAAAATLVDIMGSLAFVSAGIPRSGVSLDISVSYLDAACADEEIEIEGKVLRAGKAVGVVAVELRRKHSGKIIAQGRHTKYLAASSRL